MTLPADVAQAVADAQASAFNAGAARAKARESSRRAARMLLASGLSVRESAAVLGVSKSRLAQLAAGK